MIVVLVSQSARMQVRDDFTEYAQLVRQGILPRPEEAKGPVLDDFYIYKDALGKELLQAAEDGNLTGARQLLKLGVDINFAEWTPHTLYAPLMVAAAWGKAEMVHFLLDAGASVDQVHELLCSMKTLTRWVVTIDSP
jgi:ankyrin repeat protein